MPDPADKVTYKCTVAGYTFDLKGVSSDEVANSKCVDKQGKPGKVTKKTVKRTPAAPQFNGPAEIGDYSGPFNQSIRALYLLLKDNPGVEVQIGEYVLKHDGTNFVITKHEGVQTLNPQLITGIGMVMQEAKYPIKPEPVLTLIQNLGNSKFNEHTGKRVDLAKLINAMKDKTVNNVAEINSALGKDGVVTDPKKNAEIGSAVTGLGAVVSAYKGCEEVAKKPALAAAVRKAAERLTAAAAGGLDDEKISNAIESAKEILTKEEARVKAAQEKVEDFQKAIATFTLADIINIADGADGANISGQSYTQEQLDAFLKDREIKKAIGTRILTLLEEEGQTKITSGLHPYIKAALNEKANHNKRVIIFEYENINYAVVVSGEYSRGWNMASKNIEGIDAEDVEIQQGPDDSQPGIYINGEKIAGQTTLAPAPDALNPNQPRIIKLDGDQKLLYFPESGVLLQWGDMDEDYKIDDNEKETVVLGVEDKDKVDPEDEISLEEGEKVEEGVNPGLSEELFRALYHNMNADGNSAGEADIGDLERGFEKIAYYAEKRMKCRHDLSRQEKLRLALELYNTRDLENRRITDAAKAEKEIAKDINGIEEANDKNDFLVRKGYAAEVAGLSSAYISYCSTLSTPITLSTSDIAEFMMTILAASRMDEEMRIKIFRFNLEEMTPFEGRQTAGNYIAWLKGREVKEDENPRQSFAEISDYEDAAREFRDAGSDRKKYEEVWKNLSRELKQNDELRYTYYNLILGEAKNAAIGMNVRLAIVYFNKTLGLVEGFKEARYKDQTSKQLFDEILENKSLDSKMLLLAVGAANISGGKETPQRNERLARVAAAALQLYLDTKDESMKKLTLACLKIIPETLIFSGEDGEKALRAFSGLGIEVTQGATAEELTTAVDIKLRTDVELLNLERKLFVRDNNGGVSIKAGDTVNQSTISGAITTCESIINSEDASDYNKAQAYLLKGRLLRARAEKSNTPGTLNQELFEAQRCFRQAYETFKTAGSDADYDWEKDEAVFWMCENVRLVAFNLSGAENESPEDKKLHVVMQQLLRFIPQDKTFIRTAALSDWMGQGWPRGNVKHDIDNGMQKQLAAFLQEFCKDYGKRKMGPADLIPADQIGNAQYKGP